MANPVNNQEISIKPRIGAILGWSGFTVFLVAAIAFAILFTLSKTEVIKLSHLVLFAPAGAAGGLGAILGGVGIALYCQDEQAQSNTPPEAQSNTPPEDRYEQPGPLKKSGSEPEKTIPLPISWKEKVELFPSLHPVESEPFAFSENFPLQKLDDSDKALSCLLLLMGDFMRLTSEQYFTNNSLSLSFLIYCLEKLGEEAIVDKNKLDLVIRRFKIAYEFNAYLSQLREAKTCALYNGGRSALTQKMLDILEKERTLGKL